MLDELELSSLEARKDWSSLLLFHKIHSGAVSKKRQVRQLLVFFIIVQLLFVTKFVIFF